MNNTIICVQLISHNNRTRKRDNGFIRDMIMCKIYVVLNFCSCYKIRKFGIIIANATIVHKKANNTEINNSRSPNLNGYKLWLIFYV